MTDQIKQAYGNNSDLVNKLKKVLNKKDADSSVRCENRPTLTKDMIDKARREIKDPKFATLTGLIAHIAYWSVFGHLNKSPLDDTYKKVLFTETSKIKAELDMKYQGKYIYTSLIMPILILCLRIELDAVFKYCYPEISAIEEYADIMLVLVNDVITRLLDPNLFFSRFSFFESDKSAVNLKFKMKKGGIGLPALKAKYNTRSPLMKALVPKPSEGTCRIMFTTYKSPQARKLPRITSVEKHKKDTNIKSIITSPQNLNKSVVETRNKVKFFTSDPQMNSSYAQEPSPFKPKFAKNKLSASKSKHQTDLEREKKGELFVIAARKVNKDFKKKRMDEIFMIH